MRVLVAENDITICDMICEVLEQSGMTAGASISYHAASALMLTCDWDVLLSDLLFSGPRTGLDLADEAAARGIRCVIMSGALDRRDEVEAKGLRFLAKPFRTEDLLEAIAPARGESAQRVFLGRVAAAEATAIVG